MGKTVNDIAPGGASVAAGSIPSAVPGQFKRKRIMITGDNNYPGGGYPVLPGDFGFSVQLNQLWIINDGTGAPGTPANMAWFWNRATQKLQLIVVSTGAEVAGATDVHLATCDVEGEGY